MTALPGNVSPIDYEDWIRVQQMAYYAGAHSTEKDSHQWDSVVQWVCPLSLFLIKVIGRCSSAGWSCPEGTLALFPSGKCRLISATTCVHSRATTQKLQDNLQMILLVLVLEVSCGGQAENLGQLLLVPSLGSLSKMYTAHPGQVLLFWEILGISAAWAQTGHMYGKLTGNSLMGPEVEWGRISGNHLGWENHVSQLDGDLGMAPACRHGVWMWWAKEQWHLSALCLRESCSSCAHPNARQFISSLYDSGTFWAASPFLELRVSKSE